MTIDTTKPLEVVNEKNGERVAVTLRFIDDEWGIAVDGGPFRAWNKDGVPWVDKDAPFRLRNVPEPEPIDWSDPDKLELSDGTRVTRVCKLLTYDVYLVGIEGDGRSRLFNPDGTFHLPEKENPTSWPVNNRTVRNRKAGGLKEPVHEYENRTADVLQKAAEASNFTQTSKPVKVIGASVFDELTQLCTRNAELERALDTQRKASDHYSHQHNLAVQEVVELRAWKAAAIEAHSDLATVGPDLIEAREVLERSGMIMPSDIWRLRCGKMDNDVLMVIARASLKRGRELASTEAGRG